MKRKNFGKLKEIFEIPDLLSHQLDSYSNFLQIDTSAHERKLEGLQEVLSGFFPIESQDKQ